MERKQSDRLLMLIHRWDSLLPHKEIPLELKVFCQLLIDVGEAKLVNGIWSLTDTGLQRATILLDEITGE